MNPVTIFSLAVVLQAALQVPVESETADAYLDPVAAVLVEGARVASDSANASIEAYDVIARRRITAGVQIVGRSRPVFLREMAADLSWRRTGPSRVEVLGAREAVPIARAGVSMIGDPGSDAEDLLFDPTEMYMLRIGSGTDSSSRGRRDDTPDPENAPSNQETVDDAEDESATAQNDDGDEDFEDDDFEDVEVFHPLASGSEAHYRFRTGEETTIRLQDGRSIELIELQVLPRRSSSRLLRGSFWLEAGSYRPVRGVFTLASPLTLRVPPSGSRAPLPSLAASFEIRHVAIEYALWESRWWMPRLISFEGTGRVAGVTGTVVFEQRYENFRIYSEDGDPPSLEAPDTTRYAVAGEQCEDDVDDCSTTQLLVPRDTSQLLAGPHLPSSIFARDGRLADERTLRELAVLIDDAASWSLASRTPSVDWAILDASLIHFNRVEGLTLGGSARVELAPYALSLNAWLGTADLAPSGQISFSSSGYSSSRSIELYRRIAAFTPEDRPFSPGSSIGAFLFGRDEGDYYRTTGVALSASRDFSDGLEVTTRVYHERQASVETGTNASIPYWIDDREFRTNPASGRATQNGIEVRVGGSRGLDPVGYRFVGEVAGQLEEGDYSFGRLSTSASVAFPLPGSLMGALEVGGGTSVGEVPPQRLWYVGGPGSVRGFSPSERVAGEAYWRGRAELATEKPAARLVLFSDFGGASERGRFQLDPMLISAGAGLSTLDGLFRLDVARAIRGGSGWAVRLRLDGVL